MLSYDLSSSTSRYGVSAAHDIFAINPPGSLPCPSPSPTKRANALFLLFNSLDAATMWTLCVAREIWFRDVPVL